MKQTAVEWLQDTWLNYPDLCSYDKIQEWFKQAKEMEKGQIMKTWYDCKLSIIERNPIDAEQYYNQTFKSE
jgi:hypothetical protein